MTDPNMLSISHLREQTARVQQNVSALLYLREARQALKKPEETSHWTSSIQFKMNYGASTDQGEAAAPLLSIVVRDMLPEIVQRAIQYAETGNKEALAAIGQLAETLKG